MMGIGCDDEGYIAASDYVRGPNAAKLRLLNL